MKYTCIDTHTHLNLPAFAEDREEVLARTLADQVAHINIGTTEKTSKLAVEIADANEGSWAIIGLHPIQAAPGSEDEDEDDRGGTPAPTGGEAFNSDFYRTLAKSSKVVGIGECGYDYYHTPKDSFAVQEEAFVAQIQLANELGLPLMIHTRGPQPGEESPTGRSVYEDVYQTLKQYSKVPGNIHFYAGTLPEAEKFFELGFTVSFTGVITFAKMYEDLVRAIPLTHMHAETDSPYVSPVPYRGQRCEPRYVAEVVKKIAEIKQLPLEEVQEQLLLNAERLYKINLH
ncbi:MAG: Hydrolase, TatD family [Parcubacteria group bacterium GW2011_GWF2_44_8]|nr:MAG: Hydrolase, TatD family [Parcubacteria group bacterium GW2011_GWF2_44_8]